MRWSGNHCRSDGRLTDMRLAFVVLLAFATVGCTPQPETSAVPEAPPTEVAAAGSSSEHACPDGASCGSDFTPVYTFYPRADDLLLEPEYHDIRKPSDDIALLAVREAVARRPVQPHLRRLAPSGTRVRTVRKARHVLVVNLSTHVRDAQRTAAEEAAFAQQLAHVATQFRGVRGVRLRVGGEQVKRLWGHFDWSRAVFADPDSLAPQWRGRTPGLDPVS